MYSELLRLAGPFSRVGSIVNVVFCGAIIAWETWRTATLGVTNFPLFAAIVMEFVFIAIAIYVWLRWYYAVPDDEGLFDRKRGSET